MLVSYLLTELSVGRLRDQGWAVELRPLEEHSDIQGREGQVQEV